MKQRQIQIAELTPKLVREALKKGERLVVFDAGEPIALISGAAAELQRHRDYFVHYPHDPSECFNTCWRHDGSAEQDPAAPVEEPVLLEA
jgi:antitoxin (DNA-binding transcriptional repressor) of toxin-antitoxin stability system